MPDPTPTRETDAAAAERGSERRQSDQRRVERLDQEAAAGGAEAAHGGHRLQPAPCIGGDAVAGLP